MTPRSSITIDKPVTRDVAMNVQSRPMNEFNLTGKVNQSITLEKRSDHNTTDGWNMPGVLRHSSKFDPTPGDTNSRFAGTGRGHSHLAMQGERIMAVRESDFKPNISLQSKVDRESTLYQAPEDVKS